MSRPWMPLYVADYLADTRRLTTLEHGAYLLLIMEYWQHGGLPTDDNDLAYIAGLDLEEWTRIKPRIARLFKEGWRHKRIDEELAKASEISERRKASADRRWSKRDANALHDESKSNARAGVSQPQSQDIDLESSLRSDSIVPAENAGDGEEPIPIKQKRERRSEDIELIQDVVAEWNSLAANLRLSQVSHITSKRQAAVLARAKDLVEYFDFPDARAGFRTLFSKIRGSPFLRGESSQWRADFDFAVTQSSFTKIMEGKYETETKSARYGLGH